MKEIYSESRRGGMTGEYYKSRPLTRETFRHRRTEDAVVGEREDRDREEEVGVVHVGRGERMYRQGEEFVEVRQREPQGRWVFHVGSRRGGGQTRGRVRDS